ncbi:MAG: hypothetical protein JSS61_01375 [Verrucomicrobia bacterium]|nr:hypothetical protein [Verrucomicrobiota bacterium]
MSDFETDLTESLDSLSEKGPHTAHAGHIQDPSLNQLRDQIKKVMIPLLIKTFQLKLELGHATSLPSRLQKPQAHSSPEEVSNELASLDKDLKVLLLWCQSCRAQIQKALTPPEEEPKKPFTTTAEQEGDPTVAKFFSDAVHAQTSLSKLAQPLGKGEATNTPSAPKRRWWKAFSRKMAR